MRCVSADCYFGTNWLTTCHPRRRESPTFLFSAPTRALFSFSMRLQHDRAGLHQDPDNYTRWIGRDLALRGANVLAYSPRGCDTGTQRSRLSLIVARSQVTQVTILFRAAETQGTGCPHFLPPFLLSLLLLPGAPHLAHSRSELNTSATPLSASCAALATSGRQRSSVRLWAPATSAATT